MENIFQSTSTTDPIGIICKLRLAKHTNQYSRVTPYPFAEWRKKVVEPRGEARAEWDIAREIARALMSTFYIAARFEIDFVVCRFSMAHPVVSRK